MQKLKSIKKNLSWALVGNIVYALSQWLIVAVIAKFGTKSDLGIYSLGLAVTSPIVLFFSFQLREVFVTESKNEYNFAQYFGGRILHLTIGYLFIVPTALYYSDNVQIVLSILLMGLVKSVEAVSDIILGYFQKKKRLDLFGKSQFYRGILTVLVVGFIYLLTKSIIASIVGLLIVMIIRLVMYDLKYLKVFTSNSPIFDKHSFYLMKSTFPLGITSLVLSINTNIPRYLLEHYSSIEDVGIFSALYYILVACNLLIMPISLLVAPSIGKAFNQISVKSFVKLNIKLSILAGLLFLIIIIPIVFKGNFILIILYGKEYALYTESFVILSFSLLFGFTNEFLKLSIIAAREIKIQTIISFLVTVSTLIIGFYFISLFGIKGAAYTIVLSRVIQLILNLCLLFYIVQKKRTDKNDLLIN